MFPPTLNPVILRLGSLQITYYSLVYLLGFLVCLFVILKSSKKINMSKEQVYNFTILSIIGLLIGARIFHVLFWNFSYFSQNPTEILKIWNGGMSFHGGLLGVLLVSIFYCRKNKIDFLKLADILVLPIAFFLVLARLANFINQEIVGTITNFSFCFVFQNFEGCRHPVQLYAAAGKLALFFLLLFIKKSKKFRQGFLSLIFFLLLGLGRFFLDFIREDARYFALSAGQWFSLITILIALPILIKFYHEDVKGII